MTVVNAKDTKQTLGNIEQKSQDILTRVAKMKSFLEVLRIQLPYILKKYKIFLIEFSNIIVYIFYSVN